MSGFVGIDIGTRNSCIAVYTDSEVDAIIIENDQKTIPSYVAFTSTGILFGNCAKEYQKKDPENTIYDFKRFLGKKIQDPEVLALKNRYSFIIIGDDNDNILFRVSHMKKIVYYAPYVIGGMLVEYMLSRVPKEHRKGVGTYPANYTDYQKTLIKKMYEIGGMTIMKILPEPTAGCIEYCIDSSEKKKIFVLDFGGGTIDISIVDYINGIFKVIGTSGDPFLGGEDINQILYETIESKLSLKIQLIEEEKQYLRRIIEDRKKALSFSSEVKVKVRSNTINVTRTKFDEIINPIIIRIKNMINKCLEECRVKKEKITDVVMIGGSSKIPAVKRLLRGIFAKELVEVNPFKAVAIGAATQAFIIGMNTGNLVVDVTPLSIGLETRGGVMDIIIEKNTSLPTIQHKLYSPSSDTQVESIIKIYEGDRLYVADNNYLGEIVIGNMPIIDASHVEIKVECIIDGNGILSIKATSSHDNAVIKYTIEKEKRLDYPQIKDRLEEFSKVEKQEKQERRILGYKNRLRSDAEKIIKKIDYAESVEDNRRIYNYSKKILTKLTENKYSNETLERDILDYSMLVRDYQQKIK